MKILSIFGEFFFFFGKNEKKKKSPGAPFLATRPVYRKQNYFYGQPYIERCQNLDMGNTVFFSNVCIGIKFVTDPAKCFWDHSMTVCGHRMRILMSPLIRQLSEECL